MKKILKLVSMMALTLVVSSGVSSVSSVSSVITVDVSSNCDTNLQYSCGTTTGTKTVGPGLAKHVHMMWGGDQDPDPSSNVNSQATSMSFKCQMGDMIYMKLSRSGAPDSVIWNIDTSVPDNQSNAYHVRCNSDSNDCTTVTCPVNFLPPARHKSTY